MKHARKLILYLSAGFGLLAVGLVAGQTPAQAEVTDPRGAQRSCTVVNERSSAVNVRPDPSKAKRPIDVIYPGEDRVRPCVGGGLIDGQSYRDCGRGGNDEWQRVLTIDGRVGYVAARCVQLSG